MNDVHPGINPKVKLAHLSEDEQKIVKKFANEWYVTNGGAQFVLGSTSLYRYFLVKPTRLYTEMFNLEREIVVIFSDYPQFEPRTLDAIDHAINKHQQLRLEKICSILISKDENIEKKIRDLLKSEPESRVIIPFFYEELLTNKDSYFMRNRLKLHFYSRDLFAYEAPLKKDLYFFGRNDIVHKIVNRHKSNEISGLFGLRRTGKTSIVFGVKRVLMESGEKFALIDCQNPSFHKRRWNEALFLVILEIKKQNNIKIRTKQENDYTEKNSAICFEDDILRLYDHFGKKRILIVFDEIEHLTPQIASSEHWKVQLDFIWFWQTLRSLFQKLDSVFTYLLAGTNPKCVELPTIEGHDNPIFNQIPYEYIQPFDVPQTREMVRKLGTIMGLKFREIIYSKLTEDFGGHPFLIRHVCSIINKLASSERPVTIDKAIFKEAKKKFTNEYSNYIEMLLSVLKEFYNNEYEMLRYLALEDMAAFNVYADSSPAYTNHLLGYGIVDKNNGKYFFRIESVKDYLVNKHKYEKMNLSDEEKWIECCERRNKLEPSLRKIVRMVLYNNFGPNEAKNKVLETFSNPDKAKYSNHTLNDLLNPNKTKIYFDKLREIIRKNWPQFEYIFDRNLEQFENSMRAVNKYRADAHAKKIETGEMETFRTHMSNLERQVQDYLG